MTKVILGCSYIEDMDLLSSPFENFIKIGMGGCDNKTLCNAIIDVKRIYDPTYVFVSFTGLNRVSYPVSFETAKLYDDYHFKKENTNEVRLFSGGFYGSWIENKGLQHIFKPLYLDKNIDHVKQNSLIDCLTAINFLEVNDIRYHFTFAYDPLQQEDRYYYAWGAVTQNTRYYWDLLPKDNYFDQMHLYDFAKKHKLLREDNVHPTQEAYNSWFECINKNLNLR